MTSARMLCTLALLSSSVFAQSIVLPGTLSVQATSSTGTGFTYNGTLTQAATINLTATGAACEQAGGVYCTNASGVLTVAGSSPVGAATSFSGSIGGFTGSWNFGSLIMTISGVGSVQLFAANVADGLGSSSPPSSLTLPATSLSALGFSNFSVANPTITFTVADNLYTDNSGGFSVSSSSSSTPLPTVTPAPATLVLVVIGMVALLLAFWSRRRVRSL
jgi:hypothetical protein